MAKRRIFSFMSMEYFAQAKREISDFLSGHLGRMAERYSFMEPWGRDMIARVEAFGRKGKMTRGGLVLLGHGMFGGERRTEALRCAAAMELFQSAFLIHDDIMDRDDLRRGEPSYFRQYQLLFADAGLRDSLHQGEAFGTCGGDAALFLGFDLLSMDDPPPGFLSFCSRELAGVAVAQAHDLHFGVRSALPSYDDIMTLYAHKTGRYSFSLPLVAGALLAGKTLDQCKSLEALGEHMGVAFQIRDDELGIFGSQEELGKPIGSDIREGKKTLFFRALMDSLDPGERERIGAYFGSSKSGRPELEEVRTLLDRRGGRARVRAIAEERESLAAGLIAGIEGADEAHRAALGGMLGFISRREA
jgi:geranylgeranyl diphosphate synthase type I